VAADIGLVNSTIGFFLKVIFFPLNIATLGSFRLIINGIMPKLTLAFVPGLHIQRFGAAFWGTIRAQHGQHAAEVARDTQRPCLTWDQRECLLLQLLIIGQAWVTLSWTSWVG
jgi:hypothetical protein